MKYYGGSYSIMQYLGLSVCGTSTQMCAFYLQMSLGCLGNKIRKDRAGGAHCCASH